MLSGKDEFRVVLTSEVGQWRFTGLDPGGAMLAYKGLPMGIISRGFSGRRTTAAVKLPPGQYLTTDFPVLSAGPTPRVPLDKWEFVIDDGTESGSNETRQETRPTSG
jgi:hypothetical protein